MLPTRYDIVSTLSKGLLFFSLIFFVSKKDKIMQNIVWHEFYRNQDVDRYTPSLGTKIILLTKGVQSAYKFKNIQFYIVI